MQLWTVCFITLFLAAQLYQTIQSISLPLPVYILAGALLAIASNVRRTPAPSPPAPSETTPPANSASQAPQTASASANPFLSQTHRPLPSATVPAFPGKPAPPQPPFPD